MYHLGRIHHFPKSEFDAAMKCYHQAETILTNLQSSDPFEVNVLIMVYNGLLESLIGLEKFQDADKYGKKSLDISNHLVETNSYLVEWTLHLMARVMLALQQYFYAEGLFRKLDNIMDQNHEMKKPFYEVQLKTLQGHRSLMESFKRTGDVKFLTEKIDSYANHQLCPDIFMHAHFQDLKFVELE